MKHYGNLTLYTLGPLVVVDHEANGAVAQSVGRRTKYVTFDKIESDVSSNPGPGGETHWTTCGKSCVFL